MFNISGTLKSKQQEQKVSDKFRKREFVLTENSSQYPQMLSFQLTQDRCGLIDAINPGEEIKVFFNLRGREWTSPQGEIKYFNTLEAWKIEAAPKANQAAVAPPVATPPIYMNEPVTSPGSDDLPF